MVWSLCQSSTSRKYSMVVWGEMGLANERGAVWLPCAPRPRHIQPQNSTATFCQALVCPTPARLCQAPPGSATLHLTLLGTARPSCAEFCCQVPPGTVNHSQVQPGTAMHSQALPGTAKHNRGQPGSWKQGNMQARRSYKETVNHGNRYGETVARGKPCGDT